MFHIWSGLKHLEFDSAVAFQALEARLTHITQGGSSQGDLRRIMDVVSAWVNCEPEVPATWAKRPRLPERYVPPSDLNLRPAPAGLGVEGMFGEPQFGWPIVHPDPDEYASSEESDHEPADRDDGEEALRLPPDAVSLQALNARIQTWMDHASEHLLGSEEDPEVSSRRCARYAEEPSRPFSELQTDAAGELVPSYSRYYKARPVVPARKQRYRRESLDSRTSSNYW